MNETLDLFAVPPEVETGKPPVEPRREETPVEDKSGAEPGSIKWYAEKQREYYNAGLVSKPKPK